MAREQTTETPPQGKFETDAGIPLPDRSTTRQARDAPFDYDRAISGRPGEFRSRAASTPTMYRGRLWTMRQYAGFGRRAESNQRYKFLLASGQTGLSVAFDLPTQMGRDSDHALARGEVGRVGRRDRSHRRHARPARRPAARRGLDLDDHQRDGGDAALPLRRRRRRARRAARALSGTIQNDILKEYIARGTYIYPPRAVDAPRRRHLRLLPRRGAALEHHQRSAATTSARPAATPCRRSPSRSPTASPTSRRRAPPASTSTTSRRGSRSSSTRTPTSSRRSPSSAPRARLWARIMRDRFGARDPRSLMLRFHAQTAGSTLTAQQPLNNVVRTTVEALAAVLGGAQSLHTNGYDEALALPTEESARAGAAHAADPRPRVGRRRHRRSAGRRLRRRGADQRDRGARAALIADIDELGGMVAAIEAGFPAARDRAARLRAPARRRERRARHRRRQRVRRRRGAARRGRAPPSRPGARGPRPSASGGCAARRDAGRAPRGPRLERAARGTENLLPHILASVKARATVGKIPGAGGGYWGEVRPIMRFCS